MIGSAKNTVYLNRGFFNLRHSAFWIGCWIMSAQASDRVLIWLPSNYRSSKLKLSEAVPILLFYARIMALVQIKTDFALFWINSNIGFITI